MKFAVLVERLLPGLLSVLLFAACCAKAEEKPEAVPASAAVEVRPARLVAMTETLIAYGTVEYAPEQSQTVKVQGDGLVTKVLVAAGQRVHRGDLLVELTATANARTELENAQITVTFARKDRKRLRDLRARQLATNAEVQVAEEHLAKAEATLANVRKRQGATTTRVPRATMDGVVDVVNVQQGEIAAAGTPLLRLAKGDRLRVRLGVEAEDLDQVREGQEVRVAPLYAGSKVIKGQVRQIYRQIDPKTRLAEVVVPLPAAPTFLPGSMVRGEIILSQRPEVLAVPRAAVLSREGRPYVFVAQDGRAARRWVEIGQDDGEQVEIRQGLEPGEPVVSLGNYVLEDGMALRIQGPR